MIDTLARIHSVDVDAVGLAEFGKRVSSNQPAASGGYIVRQVKVIVAINYILYFVTMKQTWTKQYRASETQRIDDMEYLLAALVELLPKSAESTSCLVN